MTVRKKIISYILSIILAILLIAIVLISCISSNILNQNNMKKSFRKTGYYYNLLGIIKENAESEIMPSGFEINVLDNVFTEEKVTEDVNIVIDSIYENRKVEISTEEMKKILDENVQKQVMEKNYKLTDETKKGIEDFENSVINIYKDHIIYSEDTVNKIGEMIVKTNKIKNVVLVIACILSIILAVGIFVLNKSSLGISLLVAGIFFIFLSLYSGTAIVVNNILMFNWALSSTIIFVVKHIINNMFVVGLCLGFVGLGEIVVCGILRGRNKWEL